MSTRQQEYLLPDLSCQALKELSNFPGCPAVELNTPLALTAPAGPADPLGCGGRAVRAVDEATVGHVESGVDLASSPPAYIAVQPDWRHDDKTDVKTDD